MGYMGLRVWGFGGLRVSGCEASITQQLLDARACF